MWPSDLTLAVTLTLNFQGEIWIFIYPNQNWPDCHETKSKHIDLNSRPQIWPMGLTLAMTLIFEFWRSYVILTIWWPRSGVRIYQIVTGVTSDVGLPSTHLVHNALELPFFCSKCCHVSKSCVLKKHKADLGTVDLNLELNLVCWPKINNNDAWARGSHLFLRSPIWICQWEITGAWMRNYISQNTVDLNYYSMPKLQLCMCRGLHVGQEL